MTFEASAVAVSEAIIDALGAAVTYQPLIGAPASITAVVETSAFLFDTEDGSVLAFETYGEFRTADVPNIREGDCVVKAGTTYQVATVEPDSFGVTRCKLREAHG